MSERLWEKTQRHPVTLPMPSSAQWQTPPPHPPLPPPPQRLASARGNWTGATSRRSRTHWKCPGSERLPSLRLSATHPSLTSLRPWTRTRTPRGRDPCHSSSSPTPTPFHLNTPPCHCPCLLLLPPLRPAPPPTPPPTWCPAQTPQTPPRPRPRCVRRPRLLTLTSPSRRGHKRTVPFCCHSTSPKTTCCLPWTSHYPPETGSLLRVTLS